ncbi:MAG TPA: class I SAM-dependent methyltransferase [Zoogloea sp.]|uniref:class I SAM-dependent methyltransferase n=1 Tax=Zoogloea sp. TaxID=49181 RepID=UPI002C7DF321|nr:class I SAM-dependent methyltransferase [Zoogloea sp.]HMV17658.1 class I SAM-dependent methyltransferase [Rhodocyclaceae bacterium]HMZ76054.1 class I SAM-dependent methyltransferase [Rhodocyclaceae bacterium]HNI47790.1 class I SAM-dependent methyltransferase [Zoogloea sp.]
MHALLAAIASAPRLTDAGRLFHGRGGLHPGCEHWTLDVYPPVWLTTSFQPVDDAALAALGDALSARWAQLAPGEPLCWVHQTRDEVRADTRTMAGQVPAPHVVSEAGARFYVHLPRGFNHGFFLDMAEGRRWVREHVAARPGARVLNLFAYTCAFSVVALQAGAGQVANVDMAGGALAIGQRNHLLNGLNGGASFLPHDIFASWGRLRRGGPYDLIVVDPPSYQKGSFVAEKDYPRLMRRLPELLAPGGHALLCLNSPKLGMAFLQDGMAEQAPTLGFVGRLPNPPAFADVSDERALKVLVYRAPD